MKKRYWTNSANSLACGHCKIHDFRNEKYMLFSGWNRYQKGKIYSIVDVGLNLCYIGSTCARLSKTMGRHGADYQIYVGGKKHSTIVHKIFNEYGKENCKSDLVANYPCHSKQALLKREGFQIQTTEGVNRCVAGTTSKWYENITIR